MEKKFKQLQMHLQVHVPVSRSDTKDVQVLEKFYQPARNDS